MYFLYSFAGKGKVHCGGMRSGARPEKSRNGKRPAAEPGVYLHENAKAGSGKIPYIRTAAAQGTMISNGEASP
jgi:hypothetical protein